MSEAVLDHLVRKGTLSWFFNAKKMAGEVRG